MNSRSKNEELISVVIVNWNGKKWLKKCLDSFLVQTYKPLEVIVVDNSSSDGSSAYIKQYFPDVKLIQNRKNLGYSTAVNIGISHSSGEYLLLINNDTWVQNNFVTSLINFYSKHDYSVISPLVKDYGNKDGKLINLPNIDPTGSPAYVYPVSRVDKLFYLSSCYFCSKKVYLATLGFDNDYFAYYEDVDWFWRLQLLKKTFNYARGIYVYHAGGGSTGAGLNKSIFLWRNQNSLRTLLKNYSLTTLLIIIPVYFLQNLFEILFCLIILRPDLAFTYIQGWLFNIEIFPMTLKKRRWIQKRRLIGDVEVMKKMYFGSGKFLLLKNYLGL